MRTIGTFLLLLRFVVTAGCRGGKHKPIFTVSKETTYLTGPMDKDGYIDYAAALNERLSRGVTPENNADAVGCTDATRAAGATWVVRSHHVEYLRPAVAGDRIEVRTWVADFRRAFSLRKYELVRQRDGTLLARGETNWAFVEAASGRPRSVPEPIRALFDTSGPG